MGRSVAWPITAGRSRFSKGESCDESTNSTGATCFILAILAGAGAALLGAGSPPVLPTYDNAASNALIVHEWGTFLGMSGSDGASLDGMYHEEHALPAFVHSRGRDQLRLPSALIKGETPVIYFYTKEPQRVQVGVGFPRGVWTQWYPQASSIAPTVAQSAEKPDRLNGGQIYWQAEVIPHGNSVERSRCQRRRATRCGTTLARSTLPRSKPGTAPRIHPSQSLRSSCFTADWARLVCRSDWTRETTER